jgi:hypothetical protein
MLAPKPFHNPSFYVEAEMNGVAVKRVMVDPYSAVNLIPMSTVEALGIPKENIGGAPIEVYDFSSYCQILFCRNGMVRVNCNLGPFKSPIEFQVFFAPTTYHAPLGRP